MYGNVSNAELTMLFTFFSFFFLQVSQIVGNEIYSCGIDLFQQCVRFAGWMVTSGEQSLIVGECVYLSVQNCRQGTSIIQCVILVGVAAIMYPHDVLDSTSCSRQSGKCYGRCHLVHKLFQVCLETMTEVNRVSVLMSPDYQLTSD